MEFLKKGREEKEKNFSICFEYFVNFISRKKREIKVFVLFVSKAESFSFLFWRNAIFYSCFMLRSNSKCFIHSMKYCINWPRSASAFYDQKSISNDNVAARFYNYVQELVLSLSRELIDVHLFIV